MGDRLSGDRNITGQASYLLEEDDAGNLESEKNSS